MAAQPGRGSASGPESRARVCILAASCSELPACASIARITEGGGECCDLSIPLPKNMPQGGAACDTGLPRLGEGRDETGSPRHPQSRAAAQVPGPAGALLGAGHPLGPPSQKQQGEV